MKITWFGQSFFQIQSETAAGGEAVRVITDPYGEGIGYSVPQGLKADAVTVSHQHKDHNNILAVGGNPKILQSSGVSEVKGVSFFGVPTFHDPDGGKKRGGNICFTFCLNGVRISHLGDLGHVLSPEQAAALKDTDILMIPVGGHYTIDAGEALHVIMQLNPKIVIPMHYRLPGLIYPLALVDEFLEEAKSAKLPSSAQETLDINKESLPRETEIFVLTARQ